MTTSRALPITFLLFNALVWGVSWWPFRQLNALGLHSLWATGFAFALSTVLISLWRRGAWSALLSRPVLGWLVLASGVTNAAFNWGVMVGEVVRVVLLFYLMPVWAALLARWLLAEPITPAAVARIGLALAGAVIVLYEPGMGLPLPASLPDWLGLVGGAGFAVVNVMLRRQAGDPDEARALAMFVGGAAVALAMAALLTFAGEIAPPPAAAPLWLAGLTALALTLLAGNLALQYGAARLPAAVTALVMLSEIVFAALSSAWLGGETLQARTLAGGTLIVAAAAMAALPGRRASARRP
jgi:drug/metabolite transporter (DMT)-like permease